MSTATHTKRISITDLQAMKGVDPIVVLTAYSAPVAALLNDHADCIIMGDSLGMVCYGMDSTLGVTLDMMIAHGRAVTAHAPRPCVIIDLPFGSYQASCEQAFMSASRLMVESGAQAVKLEGGMEMVDTVAFLSARGIPVMAHIGLKPQHLNAMGGYKYQGRNEAAVAQLKAEAKAFEQAGAFALLLEGITESTAREITEESSIFTIGIGASPACDGQVLVTDDMVGLTATPPRFVERYADMRQLMQQAIADYASAVRQREFPQMKHCFGTTEARSKTKA